MTTQQAVSAMVRYAMAARGESTPQLAKVLGIATSGVSHRLNGQVAWRVDELDTLAAHFGVDVVDLIASPLPQLVGSSSGGSLPAVRSRRGVSVTRKYSVSRCRRLTAVAA